MEIRDVLPPDTIPSIDDPKFGASYFGNSTDCVIRLEGFPARAYPICILHFHEIVNDVVVTPDGEEPVAVTWCPLCGSAIVYNRIVAGRTLSFGVSGKLADDDLVMYDRETESEWKQSTGECIVGELIGVTLSLWPAAMMPWSRFDTEYEHGIVLQPPCGKSEAASATDEPEPIRCDESPYAAYFESEGFGLDAHRSKQSRRRWDRTDLDPKTVVLGIERDGDALAFPRPHVRDAGMLVEATIGDTELCVVLVEPPVNSYPDRPGVVFSSPTVESPVVIEERTCLQVPNPSKSP